MVMAMCMAPLQEILRLQDLLVHLALGTEACAETRRVLILYPLDLDLVA